MMSPTRACDRGGRRVSTTSPYHCSRSAGTDALSEAGASQATQRGAARPAGQQSRRQASRAHVLNPRGYIQTRTHRRARRITALAGEWQ